MKFKVDDEVEVINSCCEVVAGRIGKVVVIQVVGNWIGVDFEKGFNGHNLQGKIKTYTGYWIHPSDLRLLSRDQEITGRVKVIGEL